MSQDYNIGSDLWPGLSKLTEEAGELVQVLGKLVATGGSTEHWDGSDLGERLLDELADLKAAAWFFADVNGLDRDRIDKRVLDKFNLFHKWHGERLLARREES